MNEKELRDLLNAVKKGTVTVEYGVEQVKKLPYKDLGFAKVDHHRELRTGYPEVVFCLGKTTEQVLLIMQELLNENSNILATRAEKSVFEVVVRQIPDAVYNELARTIIVARKAIEKDETKVICVVSAG
ncbi:MAG: 1-(5-phosphoribosyl)-5-amino-4-imidazole-carboxylate carboxylase, partial [Oscillospiraceae bacterium]|nr:1-(5-phosphoribosyl)-5-amino-4-imidazole-carboxylate carboxylase [Oscillospiraceae bacterium]